MAGLKFALGLIPKTSQVEDSENKLQKEFNDFREFEASEELKHYIELEREVLSAGFIQRKKELFSMKYKNTPEYAKESEFFKLENSKAIKTYFKVKDSKNLSDYEAFKKSDLLQRLNELELFIKSDAVAKAKANMSPKEYKTSPEAAKETEYLQLLKSPPVKKHFKFGNSPAFGEYQRVEKSDILKKYKELKEYVNTEKFKEIKTYMNLPGKKKFILSEEYKKEIEYSELKSSAKIIWYFKTKKNYPFGEIEKWDLVFEDSFEGDKPDTRTWMFRYINGDKLIKKPYVLADDLHAFTDGKNISVREGQLSIVTKPEKAGCMTWAPMTGFTEKEYSYTSDLLSSANGFIKKYGLFKAKVKIGNSAVTQAFSLMADQMLPHVDIFKYERNKLLAGNFWKNGGKEGISRSIQKTGGKRYTQDYFIYSVEWSPEKLIWKINGVTFKVQAQGIPDTEMHLVFNASLKQMSKISGLPSRMEIDWVRVYERIKS